MLLPGTGEWRVESGEWRVEGGGNADLLIKRYRAPVLQDGKSSVAG